MRRQLYVFGLAAAVGCSETSAVAPLEQRNLEATAAAVAPRYTIEILADRGGAQSRGMAINEQGWVAGWSMDPTGARQAVLWRSGGLTPLGTLGGPNSTVPWAGLNEQGTVVGISQTGDLDPNQEAWSCELGAFLPGTAPRQACLGFVWRDGAIAELPTLGGPHGFATGINESGSIVGWSERQQLDATCVDAQRLSFVATLWERRAGGWKAKALLPSTGHTASAATAINDQGVAVGISGDCDQAVGRFSARHAVRWDATGRPTRIPDLGGVTWHTPMDINEGGDVVGFSNPPGPGDPEGDFIARAFYWVAGSDTAIDLRTLRDDVNSQAFAINAHRQIVGISSGGSARAHGFLFLADSLYDLNSLVTLAPGDEIVSAQDINDAGQITGRIRIGATGIVKAFILTPVMP
jgi:probable HAF family extracellular repeat protein